MGKCEAGVTGVTQKVRAASTPLSAVRIRRVLRPAEDRPPFRDRLRWSRIGVVAASRAARSTVRRRTRSVST